MTAQGNPLSLHRLIPYVVEKSLSDDPRDQKIAEHGRSLVARMSEAQKLQQVKGANPVEFLLKRFDFSEAPFEIWFSQSAFKRECCTLLWKTGGVERYEPGTFDSPRFLLREMKESARVTYEPPKTHAFAFQISERCAFDDADSVVRTVRGWVHQYTGFVPRVTSELHLFRKLHPEYSAEGL
jgi:hypothetical protein